MKESGDTAEWLNPRADARVCARDYFARDDRSDADSREYTAARRRSRRDVKPDRFERGDE